MAYFTIADALGQDSDADEDKSSVDVKVFTPIIQHYCRDLRKALMSSLELAPANVSTYCINLIIET